MRSEGPTSTPLARVAQTTNAMKTCAPNVSVGQQRFADGLVRQRIAASSSVVARRYTAHTEYTVQQLSAIQTALRSTPAQWLALQTIITYALLMSAPSAALREGVENGIR